MLDPAAAGPFCYDAGTILTLEQLSAWLQLSPRYVAELGLPALLLPGRTLRFSAAQVLRYLEGERGLATSECCAPPPEARHSIARAKGPNEARWRAVDPEG